MKPEGIKKILIVKLCCLGDIVFITPTINSLKANYPDAHISILISDWVKPLIPYLENIDEIISFNGPFEKSAVKKIASTLKIILKLRSKKFDLSFLGHRNNFYGKLLLLSGIKNRMGFEGTANVNISAPFDFQISEPKRYLNILSGNSLKILQSFTSLVQKKNIRSLRSSYNLPEDKIIVGLFPFGGTNPGTQMNIKRWDISKFLSLVERLKEIKNIHIVLFEGTKEDEKINNFSGSQDISKKEITFDLISACNVFVSGDTGPLHIAAAFGVKTLALFGPSDPDLVAPGNNSKEKDHHKYVFKNVECSPCYTPKTAIDVNNKIYWQNGSFICHTGTLKCLKEITVDDVYTPLIELINLHIKESTREN